MSKPPFSLNIFSNSCPQIKALFAIRESLIIELPTFKLLSSVVNGLDLLAVRSHSDNLAISTDSLLISTPNYLGSVYLEWEKMAVM